MLFKYSMIICQQQILPEGVYFNSLKRLKINEVQKVKTSYYFTLKAGFHKRWSRSRSPNRKRKAIRSTENQIDRVGRRTPIPLMTRSSSVMIQSQKQKNKPITMLDSGPCDWLLLPLLLPTLTI